MTHRLSRDQIELKAESEMRRKRKAEERAHFLAEVKRLHDQGYTQRELMARLARPDTAIREALRELRPTAHKPIPLGCRGRNKFRRPLHGDAAPRRFTREELDAREDRIQGVHTGLTSTS